MEQGVPVQISFDRDANSLFQPAIPDAAYDQLQQLAMGRYGPTVATLYILESYARLGLMQTIFMAAWCMARYPEMVDALLQADHEFAHHFPGVKCQTSAGNLEESGRRIPCQIYHRSAQSAIRKIGACLSAFQSGRVLHVKLLTQKRQTGNLQLGAC